MTGNFYLFFHPCMTNLFLRKAMSILAAFAVLVTLAPQVALATTSPLAAPTNVEVVGGPYTNDTTPTFTWDRPAGATWFEYAFDTVTNDYALGNVDSFTATSEISSGWHTFYVWAHDAYGNQSAYASVTFEIDTTGPTVPAVSPSSATEGEAVKFYVYPYGESAPTSCVLYVDGSYAGTMYKNGLVFVESYTFTWDGTYTVYARCTDGDGNVTNGTSRTVTVNDADDDEDETFTVPAVSPSSATEDEEVTFEVTPYGTLDADTCKLYVSGSYAGTMSEDDGEFSLDYTFSNNGTYTVYAYCEDENGDWTWGTSRNVYVYEEDEDDEFVVPAVSPSSATEDEEVTFEVNPYGDLDAETCKLYVDGYNKGTMDEDDGEFTLDYTFSNDGEYTVYAYCEDENGDWTKGTSRTVEVDNEDDDGEADRGSLIKTDCGSSTDVADPCRAVYYYDEHGDRHAFPNESTFFTWFSDFDDVEIVSKDFMASIDLSDNVTYRPGSVVVKFDTSPKVYAVEAERTLRHYEDVSDLESDYGDDWAEVLVSLPDTLYKNYEIGEEIDSKYDFDRTDAYYSVDSIEDIF